MDKHNNLCIKIPFQKRDKPSDGKQKYNRRKYNNYKLMKIPFVENLYEYLMDLHAKNGHRGVETFRNTLLNNNIYYKGIIKDIHNIINKCAVCKIKNKNIKLDKKEKFKLIIFSKPRERYIGDLTVIPAEIINNIENEFIILIKIINNGKEFIISSVINYL